MCTWRAQNRAHRHGCVLCIRRTARRLFVIQPDNVDEFLLPLRLSRLPGVGRVTEKKLEQLGIQTVEHLRGLDLAALEGHFGRYGMRLYELVRGIDHSKVIPNRPTKSISVKTRLSTMSSSGNGANDTPFGGEGLGRIA